ncbi:DUF4350 domain-containing protein [Pontibacter akesuensis]|uniref:DUF4350 domain-containing protein n=1 Tax=Pontibacter akesuensis TaxID=388950 RepID=A0A1I7GNU9_9BACT|nr:DUF4350 domain-containing protein [Pontibacter akesuensis]GHA55781.1 hypothetical protein GCM10007389_04160 [Pontibacter akesuensis]SFU50114.1 protein of unknown function [Pontibacter akesuensis]
MTAYRKYIALILLLFVALVLLDYFRPKPVDWSETYTREDKIPYGTYALYEVLPGIFKNEPVVSVREPIYNQLEDSTLEGNHIFINKAFEADSLDVNLLLDFVSRGNQVFIAGERFSSFLADTLHFDTAILQSTNPDSTALVFTSQPQARKYTYPPNENSWFIEVEEQAGHVALGRNKAGQLNFMKVPFGKGTFYISSAPLAFTNYSLLTMQQSTYAATALSHLPVQPVYWDEYQKQGRPDDQSIFRVLMRYQALKWAYYVGLAALVLFLLFKSKRTQRVIPVLEPPRNATLDFVRVIGNLYFNTGNHKNIAEKNITYFLEYLRLHYHVSTTSLDSEMQERVVAKSGADATQVNEIFRLIHSIRQSKAISDQTLLQLNDYLEDFYRQTSTRPRAQV